MFTCDYVDFLPVPGIKRGLASPWPSFLTIAQFGGNTQDLLEWIEDLRRPLFPQAIYTGTLYLDHFVPVSVRPRRPRLIFQWNGQLLVETWLGEIPPDTKHKHHKLDPIKDNVFGDKNSTLVIEKMWLYARPVQEKLRVIGAEFLIVCDDYEGILFQLHVYFQSMRGLSIRLG